MNKKIKTIGLIAPSGNLKNINEINSKIKILESHFKVKKFYDENTSCNYFSDTDENKISYIHKAFLDNEVDLVLALRGGFGSIKIIDKINYNLIKEIDKYFAGSSDVTSLLISLSKKTKINCYFSLMIANGFVENLNKNIEIIENNIFDLNLKSIVKGNAEGILWGGNLSTLVSLFSGEQYLPNKNIILFLEDLNEPLYKIDKMLYEIYRNKELRKKINGIIFGDFYFDEFEILPLLREYSELFNVPTYFTNQITHKNFNVSLPFGKLIKI